MTSLIKVQDPTCPLALRESGTFGTRDYICTTQPKVLRIDSVTREALPLPPYCSNKNHRECQHYKENGR